MEVLNRWVFLGVVSADGLGSGFHFFRLSVPVHFPQQEGVILEAQGHVGMLGTESLLANRQ